MKAIGLTEFGGPDVLRVVDLPTPEPGPGELRIRVHAAAVNPTDATFRAGGRAAQLADPDAALRPRHGRRRSGRQGRPGHQRTPKARRPGHHAGRPHGPARRNLRRAACGQRSVRGPRPKNATDAEAATLLLNAVAAHLALDALALSAGQPVAISGAAGAVGGYAVQLAKSRGLTVIADGVLDDADVVLALGADHVVARGPEFTNEVRAQFSGGVSGLIDGANLNAVALPAIADGGALASLKGWTGPDGQGQPARHQRPAYFVVRVAEVLQARLAAQAHRRLAAGGVGAASSWTSKPP